jgi:spermidine synthase
MIRISGGLLLVALTTLMTELTLIRVFDVIWYPNMAYMVITLAMFCFGLSGVYSSLRPIKAENSVALRISILSLLFGVFALAIMPIMNKIPFIRLLYIEPETGFLNFMLMFIVLGIPFFIAGLIFTTVFSTYSKKIQTLYFWDLLGAAIGCVIMVPFLPIIGPGGLLFLTCAFGVWASGLFSNNKVYTIAALVVGAVIAIIPFARQDGYYDFKEQLNKRGVMAAKKKQQIELSYWDPISKIDVINLRNRKHIAYDGGTQSTFIFPFDGDYKALRERIKTKVSADFMGQNILFSHYLKKDTDQEVLVIGCAGGQEIKAALTFGAKRVDAVELVDFVVQLGKNHYSEYNGNIFNHPDVKAFTGEGRSFLRSSKSKYDIIQIYSNHTSSSIAGGAGAMAVNYLQTADAYREYFSHLKNDGILQINHHIYPRMVTTAALAWKQMGGGDFQKHVLVCQAQGTIFDVLPTLLIKMEPWTEAEVNQIKDLLGPTHTKVVENPVNTGESFLSAEFYSGDISAGLLERLKFRAAPATDDKPYFNFIRKSVDYLKPDHDNYLNYSTAALLNTQLKKSFIKKIPKDILPLIVIGSASLLFTAVFILLPLYFSKAGKTKWSGKQSSLCYFSCLGAGFIIFELIFIQIFMKLIGYPLYTYSTVVFTILLAAGIGSASSEKLNVNIKNRWHLPFIGILISGIFIIISHAAIFDIFLTMDVKIRVFVAAAMIFPLGFFLGMPFPLGILAIKNQPHGAIAWAWGLNGLFTVVGGLLSVILSIYIGFKATLFLVLVIYMIAFYMFSKIRHAVIAETD